MLGHASAAMTLDLYGHLFGDELDAVADASMPQHARAPKSLAKLRLASRPLATSRGLTVVSLGARRTRKGL
jgi:hypothetical protein